MRDPRTVQAPMATVAVGSGLTLLLLGFTPGSALVWIPATIPALLVFALAGWADAHEPEPFAARVWAFAVGATVTVPVAVIASLLAEPVLAMIGVSPYASAGVVEEAVKGLAVLALAYRWRVIDSVADGIVYAALVAGGFAFTENIFYFADATTDDTLLQTFVVRGLVLPFAHPLFTAPIGAAIGWMMLRRRRRVTQWWDPVVVVATYAGAAVVHGCWNLFTFLESWWYLPFYLGALVAVLTLTSSLRRKDQRRLGDLVGRFAAVIHPDEHEILTSTQARRRVRGALDRKSRRDFDTWLWVWGTATTGRAVHEVVSEASPWSQRWSGRERPQTARGTSAELPTDVIDETRSPDEVDNPGIGAGCGADGSEEDRRP